jgi:hypothetical protein
MRRETRRRDPVATLFATLARERRGAAHRAQWQRRVRSGGRTCGRGVCDDVRNGYVSIEAARDIYGVVIDAAALAIDQAATLARRCEMRRVTSSSA